VHDAVFEILPKKESPKKTGVSVPREKATTLVNQLREAIVSRKSWEELEVLLNDLTDLLGADIPQPDPHDSQDNSALVPGA
jgi:hypothetical protein